MTVTIYTLWASMRDSEPSPWMLAAEDEYSWEGDPDRCDKVFADARAVAERNDWDVREVRITVDIDAICERFECGATEGTVEAAE